MDTSQPEDHAVFEPKKSMWQYIVADPVTKDTVIIDSVLNYDVATGNISTSSEDDLPRVVKQQNGKNSFSSLDSK